MKYNKILSILSICPSAFGGTEDFYKKRFADFISTYDADFIFNLKIEIIEAINDKEWSWKEACRIVDFYSYDECGSEETHLEEVKEIIWDVLFKNNEGLSEEE